MSTLIDHVQTAIDSPMADLAWVSLWLIGWPLMMAVVIARTGI